MYKRIRIGYIAEAAVIRRYADVIPFQDICAKITDMVINENMITMHDYQIGIVDDDVFYLRKMGVLLKSFFPNADVDCYESAQKLLESNKTYTLLIIDVLLGNQNGISLSSDLRTKASYIVYYSAARESIRLAFGYNTIGFLLKTDSDEEIRERFLTFDREYFSNSITLTVANGTITLNTSKILYIEKQNRKMYLHATDGSAFQIYGSLKDIQEQTRKKFVYAHRSALVNREHIKKIYGDYILLITGEQIEISRRSKAAVEKAFMEKFI